jgi:hypothetical protein
VLETDMPEQTAKTKEPTAEDRRDEDRRAPVDRRSGLDRRRSERRDQTDRRSGLDRRRGPGRRRSDSRRSAEEGEMTEDQFEFVMAIDEYKRVNRRPFPTWTEVLDIIRALGYRKVAEPRDID